MSMVTITDRDFEQTIRQQKPVLVDFWGSLVRALPDAGSCAGGAGGGDG